MFQFSGSGRSGRSRVGLWIAGFVAAIAAFVSAMGMANAAVSSGAEASTGNYNMSKNCASTDMSQRLKGFEYFNFFVNGVAKDNPSDWRVGDRVKPGDTISIKFKLKAECAGTYVAINIYSAPENYWVEAHADQQKLVTRVGGAYQADKEYSLEATTLDCFYQFDINTGHEYNVGDNSLDYAGRLLYAGMGGDHICEEETPTTTLPPTVHNTEAGIAAVCTTDATGWNTTYKNSGNVIETLVLKSGNKVLDSVPLNAGAQVTKVYKFSDYGVAVDKTIDLTVFAGDKQIGKASVTNNCFKVSATAASTCDTKVGTGGVITLTNNGKVEDVFTVLRDGQKIGEYTIPAGQNKQFRMPMEEDSSAVIKVTTQRSNYTMEQKVELNCVEVENFETPTTTTTTTTTVPTEVLSETVTTEELAFTGTDTTTWTTTGILLLMLGVAFLGLGRRARMAE